MWKNSVKYSDNSKYSKILKIKVSDVFYQVWKHMTLKEKRNAYKKIEKLMTIDSKII